MLFKVAFLEMIERVLINEGVTVKIIDAPYIPVVMVEGISGLQLMYRLGNSWYDDGKRVFLREDSCLHYIYEESINLGSN